jgi:2-methylcitrate dehydratase PrpD
MTIAETLVERWHQLPLAAFPLTVLERTALCFEDTLAVALAAASLDVGTAASRVALLTGTGPATVWGTGAGVSASEAAMANGMLSHALDYDDLHAAAIMHSSAVVVPAAVALAERQAASGPEMLAAAAVGYQVAAVLGRLAPGPFQEHGFQSTAVLGAFAATAVAARLLRLTSDQAVHAYGIAGSMASGLMEFLSDGSDVKQMHAGWAAHSGLRAAELAAAGFSGPASVFEGRFGIFRSFARVAVEPTALDALDLDHWEVRDMAPKPYPACLCVHPQVQAILELRARGDIAPQGIDDIVEIRCDVPHFYVPLVYEPAASKHAVRTAYEGRFSAAYCMARALLDGQLTLASFAPDKLADPRAAAIASKVTYREEDLPEFPQSFPARVTVVRRNGSEAVAYVAHNLGSPGRPLTDDDVDCKFLDCTAHSLGETPARELLAAIRQLPVELSEASFFRRLRAANLSASWSSPGPARAAAAPLS